MRRFFHVKIFEWTRVFVPASSAENGVCRERKVLWGAVCGKERPGLWTQDSQNSDLHFLKGLVEELSTMLRLPFTLRETAQDHPLHVLLHPYRQAVISLRGHKVGIIGEIHPDVCSRFKIKKQRPCYFEFDVPALFSTSDALSYQVPDMIQPLSRTVSFALPQGLRAEEVQAVLSRFCSSTRVSDVYPFDENGEHWRSITYELRFRNMDGKLSADFVNAELMRMIEEVQRQFSDKGVYQR